MLQTSDLLVELVIDLVHEQVLELFYVGHADVLLLDLRELVRLRVFVFDLDQIVGLIEVLGVDDPLGLCRVLDQVLHLLLDPHIHRLLVDLRGASVALPDGDLLLQELLKWSQDVVSLLLVKSLVLESLEDLFPPELGHQQREGNPVLLLLMLAVALRREVVEEVLDLRLGTLEDSGLAQLGRLHGRRLIIWHLFLLMLLDWALESSHVLVELPVVDSRGLDVGRVLVPEVRACDV